MGLMDPEISALAMTAAFFAQNILRQDTVGTFLREGLHFFLTDSKKHASSGAGLLLRRGREYRRVTGAAIGGHSFWGRVIRMLVTLGIQIDPHADWSLLSRHELMGLPWFTPALGLARSRKAKTQAGASTRKRSESPLNPDATALVSPRETSAVDVATAVPRDKIRAEHVTALEHIGMPQEGRFQMFAFLNYTFADIVWWRGAVGRTEARGAFLPSSPLSPPFRSAVQYNYPSRRNRFYPHGTSEIDVARATIHRAYSRIDRVWNGWWKRLPAAVQRTLHFLHNDANNTIRTERDRAPSTSQATLPHIRPFQIEPTDCRLPWKVMLLGDRRLGDVTAKWARERILTDAASGKPYAPDWPGLQEDVNWQKVWSDMGAVPLPADVRSNVHLFLLRRTWNAATSERARRAERHYQVTRHEQDEEGVLPMLPSQEDATDDEAEEPYLDVDPGPSNRRTRRAQQRAADAQADVRGQASASQPAASSSAATPLSSQRTVSLPEVAFQPSTSIARLPLTDFYAPTDADNTANDFRPFVQQRQNIGSDDVRQAFSALDNDPDIARRSIHAVDLCAHGCGVHDSTQHGYVECPAVQAVWHDAMPVLFALEPAIVGTPLPLTTKGVVTSWLAAVFPASAQRVRVVLWRAAVVQYIASRRHTLMAAARRADSTVLFVYPDVAQAVASILFRLLKHVRGCWSAKRFSTDLLSNSGFVDTDGLGRLVLKEPAPWAS
ncbi:hypothetical protein IE81DRAFT_344927 [Ceraceosorus guamensis]|uniref:Uncharacterized protein n=1 Tax=Ceraceosorus guamensis TaxID=1522189 RepID=A0A316WCH1_9BASI|nr:hypothetical protein IE81DRAFT_344927 [Ceraceosorus guamensis]PWN45235.1 hypothetical protein IE81DRAFT_344927 [Ceraceosorus guamensis]